MAESTGYTGDGEQEYPVGFASIITPLRDDAAFRNYWTGSALFFSGFWGLTVVLGWLAFEITKSEFAVALFTAARFGPQFLGPLAGAMSTRVNRVYLLAGANGVALVVSGTIAVLVMLDAIQFWQIVLSGFLIGATQSSLQPVRFTLLIDLVGRRRLPSANALSSAAQMGSRIIVPAIAGWLIVVAGADIALWFSALWFIPSAFILMRVREIPDRFVPSEAGVSIFTQMADGFRVSLRHREMLGILIISFATNMCAWPVVQGFLPVFADQVLNSDATGLGLMTAANGIGSLLGSLMIATLGDFKWKGALFLSATAGFGLSLVAFAMTTYMPLALLFLFIAGVSSAGFGIMQSTLMLLLAPPEVRGQAMGVLMIAIGALPFSTLIQGALANQFGVVPVTLVAGTILASVMGILAVTHPGLRRAH